MPTTPITLNNTLYERGPLGAGDGSYLQSQAARIEFEDDALGKIIPALNSLFDLFGVDTADLDLGVFLNGVVSDNVDVRTALQELIDAVQIATASDLVAGTNGRLIDAAAYKALNDKIDGLGTVEHQAADIAGRDALTSLVAGDRVFVADASADPTVNSGWAVYRWDGTAFLKLAEAESLDLVLAGNNRLFADETTVAPATAGAPTETEIATFAGANVNRVIAYNGTDTDNGSYTYVYWIDEAGSVTLLRSPMVSSVTATPPIEVNNGVVSHQGSGVNPGTYGSSTTVPRITVNPTGHITGVSSQAIPVPQVFRVKNVTANHGTAVQDQQLQAQITVNGAAIGDAVIANPRNQFSVTGWHYFALVTQTNTVTIWATWSRSGSATLNTQWDVTVIK